MKYIFSLLFTFLLISCGISVVQAQTSEATIQTDANVITDVSVDATQELDFGIIIQDSKKTIDPIDNSADDTGGNVEGLIGNESRGYFTLDGTGGTKIDLSISAPGTLDDPGGNELSVNFGDQFSNVYQAVVTASDPTGSATIAAITNGDGPTGSDFS